MLICTTHIPLYRHTHICAHTGTEEQHVFMYTPWEKGDLTGTVQVAGLMSQFCRETLLWTWPGSDYICQLLHLRMILPPLWRELLISSSMFHQLYDSLPFLLSQEGSFYDLPTTFHRGPSKMQQPSRLPEVPSLWWHRCGPALCFLAPGFSS